MTTALGFDVGNQWGKLWCKLAGPLALAALVLNFGGIAAVSVLSLSSCSGPTVNENDPASMLNDAEEEIKSDHYQIAIDKLRAVKNKFPYSNQAVTAQLRIADVYFLQESFAEAAAAYESFRDLHPKNDKVPYAMFRAGKSYFNDIPEPLSRDLTPAQKALDAYTQFLKRFPQAPESAEANKDIGLIRKTLAAKELYIGDFYYARDFFESAKPRYKKIVELYPETDSAKSAEQKLHEMVGKGQGANTAVQMNPTLNPEAPK
jgi:outer membrane protein assembly factor BamD